MITLVKKGIKEIWDNLFVIVFLAFIMTMMFGAAGGLTTKELFGF